MITKKFIELDYLIRSLRFYTRQKNFLIKVVSQLCHYYNFYNNLNHFFITIFQLFINCFGLLISLFNATIKAIIENTFLIGRTFKQLLKYKVVLCLIYILI